MSINGKPNESVSNADCRGVSGSSLELPSCKPNSSSSAAPTRRSYSFDASRAVGKGTPTAARPLLNEKVSGSNVGNNCIPFASMLLLADETSVRSEASKSSAEVL